ncbi:MAG: YfiR family protein [Polyangiaceae bacterium]
MRTDPMVNASRVPSDTAAMVQPGKAVRSPLLLSSMRFGLAGFVVGVAGLVAFSSESAAQTGATPASSLVPFVTRAADYDRHFVARAGGRLEILVTFNASESTSEVAAKEVASAFGKAEKIAGLAHDERVEPYVGAESLAAETRSTQTAIVIISTGLGGEVRAIAHALDGIDVLTVALDPDDVSRGIVLGLDTREAKPKILVRLAQARRQDVAFEAAFLSLARIE